MPMAYVYIFLYGRVIRRNLRDFCRNLITQAKVVCMQIVFVQVELQCRMTQYPSCAA